MERNEGLMPSHDFGAVAEDLPVSTKLGWGSPEAVFKKRLLLGPRGGSFVFSLPFDLLQDMDLTDSYKSLPARPVMKLGEFGALGETSTMG